MRLIPILTEKSMADATQKTYTFWVPRNATKHQIKVAVEEMFGIKVSKVRTILTKEITKKTLNGRKKTTKPRKKAFVVVEGKDTIDLFDTQK